MTITVSLSGKSKVIKVRESKVIEMSMRTSVFDVCECVFILCFCKDWFCGFDLRKGL